MKGIFVAPHGIKHIVPQEYLQPSCSLTSSTRASQETSIVLECTAVRRRHIYSGTSTQPHAPMSSSPGQRKPLVRALFLEGRKCKRNCQRRRLQLGRGLSRERRCAAPGSACLDQHPRERARCRRCLFHPLLHLRNMKHFNAVLQSRVFI